MSDVGKLLIVIGIVVALLGLSLLLLGKFPGAGRLPGDIVIKKENFTFYFPIATSLIISAVLSLVLFLWNRR